MKRTLLVVIALAAFAAACHEERRDYDGVRQRSEAAHGALDSQQPPADK